MDKLQRIIERKKDLTQVRSTEHDRLVGYKWTGPLRYEGSWGSTTAAPSARFELIAYPTTGRPEYMELDVNDGEDAETIGLEYDAHGTVTGYDGVMSIPLEALALLHTLGIPFDHDLID
jgi:hypothetical protein